MKKNSLIIAMSLATSAILLSGCGNVSPSSGDATKSSSPLNVSKDSDLHGSFSQWTTGNLASTYNTELIPMQSTVQAKVTVNDSHTRVSMNVTGLQPNRMYGAHAHTKPCGVDGAAAGPHYQDKADPVSPSVDPTYANSKNEIWLDFNTDAKGAAAVEATVDWKVRDNGAKSIIIHDQHTMTDKGHAGMAGNRLACVNTDFNPR